MILALWDLEYFRQWKNWDFLLLLEYYYYLRLIFLNSLCYHLSCVLLLSLEYLYLNLLFHCWKNLQYFLHEYVFLRYRILLRMIRYFLLILYSLRCLYRKTMEREYLLVYFLFVQNSAQKIKAL